MAYLRCEKCGHGYDDKLNACPHCEEKWEERKHFNNIMLIALLVVAIALFSSLGILVMIVLLEGA